MTSTPYLTLVERRAEQSPLKVLFVGHALGGVTKVFRRKDEAIACAHESSVELAIAQLETESYDCALIDQRDPTDSDKLNLVSLAASGMISSLIVLTTEEHAEIYRCIPGVKEVLEAPVDPGMIIKSILHAADSNEDCGDADHSNPDEEDENTTAATSEGSTETDDENASQAELYGPPNAPAQLRTESQSERDADDKKEASAEEENADEDWLDEELVQAEKSNVTKGFEASIEKVKEADHSIWKRFVPLANFLYKKTAVIVLSALFLTFLFYGVMIVFFMTSTGWTLPFELSRGHMLVQRAERDLGQLKLRQNQVREKLFVAESELATAERNLRDGELLLSISRRTVEQEIMENTALRSEVVAHIERLKEVINEFNRLNKNDGFGSDLNSAYRKRLITKKSLHAGTLAVLETMHRIAAVSNEIAIKTIERDRVDRRIAYLKSLQEEAVQPEIRTLVSAGADLVHLAKEIIQAKNTISFAKQEIATAKTKTTHLSDSLAVVQGNIKSIDTTPVGRAIQAPVNVLFVPYDNLSNYRKGEPLYQCVLSIIWCSKAGEIGEQIDGETNAVHPLFGKPLRGVFVEALVDDPSSIKLEMLHVGRPPLFF
ncbi:MAG: hypothetical protein AAF468_02555 [Pseudomonadota bacterium]